MGAGGKGLEGGGWEVQNLVSRLKRGEMKVITMYPSYPGDRKERFVMLALANGGNS